MKHEKDYPSTEAGERNRRRLLQLLAVGGVFAGARALPESWVRPVIEEATLPAHAQMSPTDQDGEADTILTDFDADLSQQAGP